MCRVFLSNRKDFDNYDRKYGIVKLWNHLEEECGGHGNGFALLHKGKIVMLEKSMKQDIVKTHKRIKSTQWDWIIWHTRIASVGSQSDSNCHPFINKDSTSAIAMNGTLTGFRTVSEALGITDTEAVFRLLNELPLDEYVDALADMYAVFIGFHEGKPFAVKGNTGDLSVWKGGTKTLHASSFPKNGAKSSHAPYGYVWIDGESKGFISMKDDSINAYAEYHRTWMATSGKKETTETGPAAKKSKGYFSSTYDRDYDSGYEDGFEEGYAMGFDEGKEYIAEKMGTTAAMIEYQEIMTQE